jgi:hypothetical protein
MMMAMGTSTNNKMAVFEGTTIQYTPIAISRIMSAVHFVSVPSIFRASNFTSYPLFKSGV